jgi:hypothetical protein
MTGISEIPETSSNCVFCHVVPFLDSVLFYFSFRSIDVSAVGNAQNSGFRHELETTPDLAGFVVAAKEEAEVLGFVGVLRGELWRYNVVDAGVCIGSGCATAKPVCQGLFGLFAKKQFKPESQSGSNSSILKVRLFGLFDLVV